jgi:hypothetical protein
MATALTIEEMVGLASKVTSWSRSKPAYKETRCIGSVDYFSVNLSRDLNMGESYEITVESGGSYCLGTASVSRSKGLLWGKPTIRPNNTCFDMIKSAFESADKSYNANRQNFLEESLKKARKILSVPHTSGSS